MHAVNVPTDLLLLTAAKLNKLTFINVINGVFIKHGMLYKPEGHLSACGSVALNAAERDFTYVYISPNKIATNVTPPQTASCHTGTAHIVYLLQNLQQIRKLTTDYTRNLQFVYINDSPNLARFLFLMEIGNRDARV